jgi:hypothetical protein
MKLPLHLSLSLSKPVILLAVSLCGLTCCAGYQQYQIYHLSNALAATVNQDSIGAVIQRINALDDRLEKAAESPPVLMADFRAAQQASSNRIDDLKAQLTRIQESNQAAQSDSRSAASMLDIVSLEAKFEGLQNKFLDFVKVRPSVTPPSPSVKPNKPKSAPVTRVENIAKVESPPPFTVVGVEYRGGERFLSVAPPGSTRLSQLYLVRPGDTIDGSNWRLSSLDDSRAQFSINGTSRIVPLNK